MSDAAINNFKCDRRALEFTLYQHLKIQQVFESELFGHLSKGDCDQLIDQCIRFCNEVTGPLNGPADRAGCRHEGNVVKTPPGFKAAWNKLSELGFMSFAMSQDVGGFGGPHSIEVILEELQSAANTAFNMYPGLTRGAADVIGHFALPADRERFLPHMLSGRFAGTMCLSEPQAGSDVGIAKTKATPIDGNVYRITGTKCWISAGDHDLAENIVHLVLARIEGAPAGTKGLSLFMVPKVWVNADGTLGEDNDVVTASIEHKLGIKASATAVLNFGENGRCRGILVGGVPHAGIKQMFRMMNGARISVGVQGIAVAGTAYLNALHYARERMQGSSVKQFKDPNAPRVAIIEHSDVRRMLMDMKSKTEGMRTLAIKLALHSDLALIYKDKDPGLAAQHEGQVDLLTPIVKAYCSDQSFRIAEQAIQTYGGAGYVQDHPVEQYCRDAKIFSIYEGTNHIQAQDLVARKIQANGGASFAAFLHEVQDFVAKHSGQAGISVEVTALGEAVASLQKAAATLMEFFMGGDVDQVLMVSNGFLEMMAEVTLAHLLLEAATVAQGLMSDDELDSHEETAFLQGKVMSAKYFVNFVLPGVHSKLAAIQSADRSPLDIPDGGFSNAF
jgi:alkylation response protein AidB-like acyl-CoA dehydrogenase